MERPKRLNAAFVRSVTGPGRYGDGRGGFGLSLVVAETMNGRYSKRWIQRIRIKGRLTNIGLGSFPVVTLADAREAALDKLRDARAGNDPRSSQLSSLPIFRDAADSAYKMLAPTWRGDKTGRQWHSYMERYINPTLGSIRIHAVTTSDILRVLTPLWNEKRATAVKVRVFVGGVMKHAVAQNWRADNPAGESLAAGLPKNRKAPTNHHKALEHSEVPNAMRKIRASNERAASRLLVEFTVLTAVRSGEARLATWNEIDHDTDTWMIPGERMKAGRAHSIPLSTRAAAILDEARGLGGGEYVFSTSQGKALSVNAHRRLLLAEGIKADMHGFRSSFRAWCADTGQDREIAEAALAHTVGNQTEQAYQRSNMLERRRQLMQKWSDYILC